MKHHVDRIVPLRGKRAGGLHVHYNHQVITARDNQRKSNRFELRRHEQMPLALSGCYFRRRNCLRRNDFLNSSSVKSPYSCTCSPYTPENFKASRSLLRSLHTLKSKCYNLSTNLNLVPLARPIIQNPQLRRDPVPSQFAAAQM